MRRHAADSLLIGLGHFAMDAAYARVSAIERGGSLFRGSPPIITEVARHDPRPPSRFLATRPARVANSELSTISHEFSTRLNHLSKSDSGCLLLLRHAFDFPKIEETAGTDRTSVNSCRHERGRHREHSLADRTIQASFFDDDGSARDRGSRGDGARSGRGYRAPPVEIGRTGFLSETLWC